MIGSSGINKVILIGQICEDLQLKHLNRGEQFILLKLVTNEVIKKGKETAVHNEYHNIKIPANLTDQALELQVGQTVYLEGKLATTSHVDDNNVKRYHLEVIVVKLESLQAVPVIK
ncbi:single-stranded DNA-binding protein [Mucilaginibacter sp.]|uniref:single-stranded DNA-binding protein n=1 Tax=Mucilaginibacter sp. TaxID=1882438 RepID=UPI0035BC64D6